MKKDVQAGPEKTEEPKEGNALRHLGQILLLVAVLVAAWFVLDWLISGK